MVMLKIDKIYDKVIPSQFGGHGRSMECTELSLNKPIILTMWLGDEDEFDFVEGDTIMTEVKAGKLYKGNAQGSCRYYKTEKVSDIEKPSIKKEFDKVMHNTSVPKPEEVQKVDWDSKEKRDYRARCLMYADSDINRIWPNKTWTREELIQDRIEIAKKYMEFVYTGEIIPF